MRTLLLVAALVVPSALFAQPPLDWSFSFGLPSGVETPINGSVTDANGNVLVTGFIYEGTAVDMEPGGGTTNITSTNEGDVYVAKYSKAGALLWVNTMGGNDFQAGQHIEVDNDGNIIIAGIIRGSMDMDPGPGVATLTATTSAGSGFVAKYDESMNYLWSFEIPTGNTAFSVVNDIAIDGNNNISVAGGFQNSVSLDPMSTAGDHTAVSSGGFVAKYSPSGAYTYSFPLVDYAGTTDGKSFGIGCDSDDNLYVLGEFRDSINCDPGGMLKVYNSTNKAGYLAKYTANGDVVWAIPVGSDGLGNSWMSNLTLDSLDNIVVCGQITPGTYDFDGSVGTAYLTSNGSHDAFVAKYDSTGNYNWAFNIGGSALDRARDLAINSQGDIFVAGSTRNDSIDFDPSANQIFSSVVQPGAFSSHFIAKYSGSGDYLWSYIPVDDDNELSCQVAVWDTIVYMTGSGFVLDMDWNSTTPPQQYSINQGFIFKLGDQQCVPTVPIPDLANLTNLLGECSVAAPTSPTASNCTGTYTGTSDVTFPITAQGTTVVTWTYDDGNGNTSTQTQNVEINDITAPVADIATLSDVNAECSVTALTAPTATDNCSGSVAGTHNASLPITSPGTTVITWTYDDGNGNTSTQTQNVIINDITAPVPDNSTLTDVVEECEVTSLTPPTATDNCSGVIIGTHNASLPISSQGTTVVTWTYDDGNGNTSTQTQNVVVSDTTGPVVISAPDIIAECEVTSLTPPFTTSNCGGVITVVSDASLPITSQGTTVVTWTYEDDNGNVTTQAQNVIIADVTAPVADLANLPDINSECEVTPSAPTATDNCLGAITGVPDVSFPITASGTTTVTWTYDDGNGNVTTQAQNVIIADVTAPVADLANLSDINSECEVTPTSPTATDNCEGTITGVPDVSFPITASGTTTVTWTYDDGNGNTSTQTQDVVITQIDANTTTTANSGDYTISADANGYNYQWIENCGTSNDVIVGATSQSYIPVTNGTYGVIIDNGTCSVTSACVVIDDLSLEGLKSLALNVYPNPTNKIVTVESILPLNAIIIKDATGRTISSVNEINSASVDLELPMDAGIYFVLVKGSGLESIVKVIKK